MNKHLLPSRSRRALLAASVATTVALGGAAVAAPAAQAEPAGQYYYQCILTNGSSYWIWSGQTLRCTNASYLKKYINGSLVATYHLSANGTEAHFSPADAARAMDCVVAIGGIVLLFTPAKAAVRVTGGTFAAWSTVRSCIA